MKVKMYTCGPSTYQPAHIGNYRTFLFEDILQRYLEYSGYKVTRLMTLTDIEDKAIAQTKKENVSVEELTNRNEDLFFKDFELLRSARWSAVACRSAPSAAAPTSWTALRPTAPCFTPARCPATRWRWRPVSPR